MGSVTRNLLIGLTALGMVLSYSWLNGRYEQADYRKAIGLVRHLKAPNKTTTLEDVLAERFPAARLDATWSSEMLSSCRGYVRVHAILDATDYAFDVDVVQHGIHPGNEAGKATLLALSQRTAAVPVTPAAKRGTTVEAGPDATSSGDH